MSLDQIIEQKISQAQQPLLERIAELERTVKGYRKQQPFMINERPALRRIEAAKRMGVHPTTLDRMLRNPLNPLEGVRLGGLTYIYEDSMNLKSE